MSFGVWGSVFFNKVSVILFAVDGVLSLFLLGILYRIIKDIQRFIDIRFT